MSRWKYRRLMSAQPGTILPNAHDVPSFDLDRLRARGLKARTIAWLFRALLWPILRLCQILRPVIRFGDLAIDTIFTNMAQRAAANIGQYPDAVDHYIRHALKAQAGSRATLEALAKLHQPREQIVKHVNVNEGGQVVVAGQIHQHQQPGLYHENASQPYGPSAPLLGQDPQGHSVPVARDEGQDAMPTARRYVSGRAHRTSER